MNRIGILLLLTVASSADAATWEIWVHPATRTSRDFVWEYQNPRFFDRADFEAAVRLASTWTERHANWQLKTTRSRGDARITIVSRNPATDWEMYLGWGEHAVASWEQHTRTIYFHDGFIPSGTSNETPHPFWYPWHPNVQSIARYILHEIGHDDSLLGASESHNMASLAKSNPDPYVVSLVRRRFGPPAAAAEPPRITSVGFDDDGLARGEVQWQFHLTKAATTQARVNGAVVATGNLSAGQHVQGFQLEPGPRTLRIEAADQNGSTHIQRQVVVPAPVENIWHNDDEPADVNRDGHVRPIDALLVINRVNRAGRRSIPIEDLGDDDPALDVDANRAVEPADALAVIRQLGSRDRRNLGSVIRGANR